MDCKILYVKMAPAMAYKGPPMMIYRHPKYIVTGGFCVKRNKFRKSFKWIFIKNPWKSLEELIIAEY